MTVKITEDDTVKSVIHFSLGDFFAVIVVAWVIVFSAVLAAILFSRGIV